MLCAYAYYYFQNEQVFRIETCVSKTDFFILQIYNCLGFQKEGMIRDAIFCKGAYLDACLLSITKDEFYIYKGKHTIK